MTDAVFLGRKASMVAVTYGVARRSAADDAERTQVEPRKSFFARFMNALGEARLHQAHREIEKHAHLLAKRDNSKALKTTSRNLEPASRAGLSPPHRLPRRDTQPGEFTP